MLGQFNKRLVAAIVLAAVMVLALSLACINITLSNNKQSSRDKNMPEHTTPELPVCLVKDTSVPNSECLASCHKLEELIAKNTLTRDPHKNHNANLKCSVCHKVDEKSVLWCTQCHAELEKQLPVGWLTFKEYNAQKTTK